MPSEEFESAAASFKRIGQDAVTHARRVSGNAKARNQRHHSENVELLKRTGRGAKSGDPTPGTLRAAAERFRRARGLAVPETPRPPWFPIRFLRVRNLPLGPLERVTMTKTFPKCES